MPPYQLDDWRIQRFESPTRWYVAELMQDLWGQWVIRKSWGGRHNAMGNSQTEPVESYEAGLERMARLAKERARRGYDKA